MDVHAAGVRNLIKCMIRMISKDMHEQVHSSSMHGGRPGDRLEDRQRRHFRHDRHNDPHGPGRAPVEGMPALRSFFCIQDLHVHQEALRANSCELVCVQTRDFLRFRIPNWNYVCFFNHKFEINQPRAISWIV